MHFLLAGAVLFAVYIWINRDRPRDKPRLVRITGQEVAWLKETWARQWQRPPSDAELKGLVADYLKEELLAREARELGLDENDTIVRRRLAQKMEFLVQDTARTIEPTEAELRKLYETRAEQFQIPARVSFTQIFFKLEAAAQSALAKLPGRDIDGDRIMLEREYAGADEQTVTSLFGREFAGKVFTLEPGQWQGPVGSGYGFHLVLVKEREPAKQRLFEDVRAQVLAEWQREQQTKANEQFFAALFKKYDVVVDDSVQPLLGTIRDAGSGMRDAGKETP